jgi:hypothetical protein
VGSGLAGMRDTQRPYQSAASGYRIDPAEVAHSALQVEGGKIAGHAGQLQADERHDVANDDRD